LIDILKIQGLNRYFKKFGDEFGWFVKIQGRSWVITHLVIYRLLNIKFKSHTKNMSERNKIIDFSGENSCISWLKWREKTDKKQNCYMKLN